MLKHILFCIYYMKNQRKYVKISNYMCVIVEDTIWASVCRITLQLLARLNLHISDYVTFNFICSHSMGLKNNIATTIF